MVKWNPPWTKSTEQPVQPVQPQPVAPAQAQPPAQPQQIQAPIRSDLLTKWQKGELPPDLLQAANVPSYEDWKFQTYQPAPGRGIKNPNYVPQQQVATTPYQPQQQIETNPIKLWEQLRSGQGPAQKLSIGEVVGAVAREPLETIKQGAKSGGVPGALMGMYERYIGKPGGEKIYESTAKAAGWQQEPTLNPTVKLPWASPFTGEQAQISPHFGPKGVAHELASLPLWLMPAGGKAKAAEDIGLKALQKLDPAASSIARKFIEKELAQLGPESADDIVRRVSYLTGGEDAARALVKQSVVKNPQLAEQVAQAAKAQVTPQVTLDQFKTITKRLLDDATTEIEGTLKWLVRQKGLRGATEYAGDRLVGEEAARVEELRKIIPILKDVKNHPGEYLGKLDELPVLKRGVIDRGIELKILQKPEVAPRVSGTIPPVKPPLPPTALGGVDPLGNIKEKVLKIVSLSEKARVEQEAARTIERGKRFGAVEGIRQGTAEPLQAGEQALAQLKNKLPSTTFEVPPELQLTGEDLSKLVDYARTNPNVLGSEFIRTYDALINKLAKATETKAIGPLQKNEAVLFKQIFGAAPPQKASAWKTFLEVINIPRALLASLDHSMVLRQGVLLTSGYPKVAAQAAWKSFATSFKQASAETMAKVVRDDELYEVGVRHGLDLAEFGTAQRALQKGEEQYASRIASYIPWVKQSERAAVNFLNTMRMHAFKKGVRAMEAIGEVEIVGGEVTKGGKYVSQWANIVNAGSGRGNLGALTGAQPLLNAFLFSPKLLASRAQLPYYYLRTGVRAFKDPAERAMAKEMTRWIGHFVAFSTTFLGLCALAGGVVELDPRSTDVGKVRFGNTRISPLGGWEQFIRLAAQLATGQRKDTTTGRITNINRKDALYRFGEMKLSPVVGTALSILKGSTPVGEKIEWTPGGIAKGAYNLGVSIFIQDMVDAFNDAGVMGLLVAPPSFFGMTVQTYQAKPPKQPTQHNIVPYRAPINRK